ncbi:MAG: GNAT family N-acetyltransferase [Yoonia sp.]|uniref:GNAT family N-acetyltransferase n=1 Tax=Yoonia sp. TaxID=2212373 RepID=UPI00273E8CF8|nr:GNAT family N-acetyltransferase [Yoonia sp.]MDP5086487.1 GNAT family N-acetyltransferase [Yoonia sp.]MDP5361063.1 GNAT family N-acetyltransferase [Paracoccaceae bacterium]
MSISVRPLTGDDLAAALPDLARLRITVFRDWPYLYDGTFDYEHRYLQSYRDSADAILVGAFDGDRLIGAATGTPMEDHADDFGAAFAQSDWALTDIFYCAESVLLPAYRGQGIGHAFFDAREAHARRMGRRFVAFCAVMRPVDHSLRPADYAPLDPFWRKRGYMPLTGVQAAFSWQDIDETTQSAKQMQFWGKNL